VSPEISFSAPMNATARTTTIIGINNYNISNSDNSGSNNNNNFLLHSKFCKDNIWRGEEVILV
jgi:hypothetical protein